MYPTSFLNFMYIECILDNQPDGPKYCLPVDESYVHALSRDIKHLRLDGHAGLLQWATFFQRCKTTRMHFMAHVAPEGH